MPERIDRVDPAWLRREVESLWEEGAARAAQLAAFEELDVLLGPTDAIARTAEWAMDWDAGLQGCPLCPGSEWPPPP